jgi:hypothetical protein
MYAHFEAEMLSWTSPTAFCCTVVESNTNFWKLQESIKIFTNSFYSPSVWDTQNLLLTTIEVIVFFVQQNISVSIPDV